MTRARHILVSIASAAILVTVTALPAEAASRTTVDATGETATTPAIDITSVKVRNTKKRVTVVIEVADLPARNDFSASYLVWVDTPAAGRPNFQLGLAGFHGLFGHTKRWNIKRSKYGDYYGDVNCSFGEKWDARNDRVIYRIKPRCLDNPARVRVAVETATWLDTDDDGEYESYTDHLIGKHRLTPWVKR